MYFNPMAQYMPNYMYGSFGGMTSQKSYPVKLDLKPRHANDILAIGGLSAATVGLCLLGNTKGAKKTAEAAVKTAAKSTKGGFWSKLFAKKGAGEAHKKIIKARKLIHCGEMYFSPEGKPYTGWAKSWGKKMLYKDGVLVKTINRKGKQVALSQETPIQRKIKENILHKSVCTKSAKESAEVFKKAKIAQKPEHGLLYRANYWFWDKTCGFLDKVFKITGKESIFVDKMQTPASLVSSIPVFQKTGNCIADLQKMLQEMISGKTKITQINEYLKANNLPLITLHKGDKSNIKAVKTYIKNLQNYKGQAFREVVQDCKKAVSPPILDVAV